MHRVNNHHHEKSQYLASDYLNILITYLRSLPNCTKYLQLIFNKYDSHGTNRLHIDEFERLLSVLIIEACNNSGHDAPDNTELTVSYILNILIQINSNINHNVTSQINIEFSHHFITHLLTHLLSLKNKEHNITNSNSNIKLKKYKKISPKLMNHMSDINHINHRQQTNSFRINRRRTINANNNNNKTHRNDTRNKSKSRSRSKSIDLINHNEIDHVLLVSSPSNSLVMTENVLFKYQKNNKNNNRVQYTPKHNNLYHHPIPQNNHFSSRFSKRTTNSYHPITNNTNNNSNFISIERIPYHGNGSPSDSTSKSSNKSPKNKNKNNKKSHKKSKHNKHRKKSINSSDNMNIHKQINLKKSQRGVKISRRRTENNLLSIARKDSIEYVEEHNNNFNIPIDHINEHKYSRECELDLNLNNDNIMLDLLTEISELKKENKQSKQSYSNKIYDLENKLKIVESENTLMKHKLQLYEQRMAQMEQLINSNSYHANIINNMNNNNHRIQSNVSVISHSSTSSHTSHTSSSSNDHMETSYSSSGTSNKYRALEKKLHLKILREREDELNASLNAKTRKNANVTRRKKQVVCKRFDPIQLQENVQLNSNSYNESDEMEIEINPNVISIPLIIDESKPKHNRHRDRDRRERERGSYQSAISALSGSKIIINTTSHSESSNSDSNEEIIIVVDDADDNKEKSLNNHKNNILEALQQAVKKQTEKERENILTEEIDSDSNNSNSFAYSDSYFHLFKDDNISNSNDKRDSDDCKSKPKYTDLITVPLIEIPKSEKDLMKKTKPAYKHHLEMIDDDGSIAFEIEQRKKRREREKQQQQMKQLYSRTQNKNKYTHYNQNHKKNININNIRQCYFENKPLGFQINESPECIFVTNVYNNRGTAYEKGIERGWKIIQVNKQNNVKGMMEKLRNNEGPFNITFDTLGIIKNYNKMI